MDAVRRLLQQAADQEHDKEMSCLGTLYGYGRGV